MEIERQQVIYDNILPIISHLTTNCTWSEGISTKVYDSLKNISDEMNIFIAMSNEITTNKIKNIDFYHKLTSITQWWKDYLKKFAKEESKTITIKSNLTINEKYMEMMKPLQFGQVDIFKNSRFYHADMAKSSHPNIKTIQRLIQEIPSLKNNLPLSWSSTIFVRCDPNKINCLKYIIVGPEKTPYMNGMFEFDVFFPDGYPVDPPKVQLYTTGNGVVRFNPNLYNSGKVCLSLLGTWSGKGGETWNKDSSTFLQVLVSIQSLIMVDDPYFNEPGWERQMHTASGRRSNFEYSDNIRLQTMVWAIHNQIINPVPGFEEVIKKHFKMKKDEILNTVDKWIDESIKHKSKMADMKSKIVKAIDSIEI